MSKKTINFHGKHVVKNLEGQEIKLVEKKFLQVKGHNPGLQDMENFGAIYKESETDNLSKQSESYRIHCRLVTSIKGMMKYKYILVVSLLGGFPQKCVFNSIPVFASVGEAWGVKFYHLFYGFVVRFYYKRILIFLLMFSFESTFYLVVSVAFSLFILMIFFFFFGSSPFSDV